MLGSLPAILKNAVRVARTSGPGILKQLADLRRLQRFPNCVGPEEYYMMRLHALPRPEQDRILGTRLNGSINYVLSSPFWFSTIRDKILCSHFLDLAGIPTAPIRAAYSAKRWFPGIKVLRTIDELARALREELRYPVFGKASGADVGIGAMLIDGYDPATDRLVLGNGETVDVYAAAQAIDMLRYGAYIFQDVLGNAPDYAELVGPRLCTVRACVLADDNGGIIHRAFIKICRPFNVNDNWDLGRTGNAICFLDEQSGAILNVITGAVPDIVVGEDHPDGLGKLVGQSVPRWDAVRDLCARLPQAFPGLRILHADIALTADGPTVLEINEDGSLFPLQFLGRRGFKDAAFDAFLTRLGFDLRDRRSWRALKRVGSVVEYLYGMDNAYNGRGSVYEMVTSMK